MLESEKPKCSSLWDLSPSSKPTPGLIVRNFSKERRLRFLISSRESWTARTGSTSHFHISDVGDEALPPRPDWLQFEIHLVVSGNDILRAGITEFWQVVWRANGFYQIICILRESLFFCACYMRGHARNLLRSYVSVRILNIKFARSTQLCWPNRMVVSTYRLDKKSVRVSYSSGHLTPKVVSIRHETKNMHIDFGSCIFHLEISKIISYY